ncbi:MAG: hypothetical protein JOS17DRAFT_756352 [Linnemannia elongata]|nr:MAG: hypothetical protein JOS17DRAFT_756352 [Linnemannia elongata]
MLQYITHRQQRLTTTTQAVLSPLDIPEILEQIFPYLDEYTIRRSVIFVCRQWRLLNQNRIVREVTWYETWGPSRKERALQKLPGAGRLYICNLCGVENTAFDQDLARELRTLDSEHQKQRKLLQQGDRQQSIIRTVFKNRNSRQSTPTPYHNSGPLREVVYLIQDYSYNQFWSLPLPSTITSLDLHVQNSWESIAMCSLGKILKCCPLLEHFSVSSHQLIGFYVLVSSTSLNEATAVGPLRLRSLVFFNIVLPQWDLEALLPHTPNLKELKLKAMLWQQSRPYDWARLFGSLKANNITLDKAHFSTQGARMSDADTEVLMADVYSPSSSEVSLWMLDLTPQLLQTVFLQQETVTTLEICWKRASLSPDSEFGVVNYAVADRRDKEFINGAYDLVQRFLCDSPYAAHLTTLKAIVRLEDMDLFDRGGYINLDQQLEDEELQTKFQDPSPSTSPSTCPSPTVWRCRRLRTLHVEVHTPVRQRFQHPVHSRIVFGYISRVCPLLEDLQISILAYCHVGTNESTYPTYPSLQLKGGLCLLGRLRYLQRLSMENEGIIRICQYWDLNWMVASGNRSMLSKLRRRLEVGCWGLSRENEDRIEAMRQRTPQEPLSNGNCTSNSNDSIIAADGDVLDQLRDVGLLLDVEEMWKEMHNSTYQPLPSLEKISFCLPILLRPEEELERLFPIREDRRRLCY